MFETWEFKIQFGNRKAVKIYIREGADQRAAMQRVIEEIGATQFSIGLISSRLLRVSKESINK